MTCEPNYGLSRFEFPACSLVAEHVTRGHRFDSSLETSFFLSQARDK